MEPAAPKPLTLRLLKTTIIVLLVVLLAWPATFGVAWLVNAGYMIVDPTRFPASEPELQAILQNAGPESAETQKGAALSRALTHRLEQELGSTWGWSVNDLWVSPTRWLDTGC